MTFTYYILECGHIKWKGRVFGTMNLFFFYVFGAPTWQVLVRRRQLHVAAQNSRPRLSIPSPTFFHLLSHFPGPAHHEGQHWL